MGLLDSILGLQNRWDAFRNREPTYHYVDVGPGYSHRPDRPRLTRGNERTIVTSIYNRIALDVAQVALVHCNVDDNKRFSDEIDSPLNECLSTEANIDQTGRAFIQDIVMSMFDEGVVAIVPIECSENPATSDEFDIYSMRTGKIIEWHPQHVKVRVYNDQTGEHVDLMRHKKTVGIIENPFYAVMNEPNSTMQRLIKKLSLMDSVDEQASSGKLDMIIQLPYVIKSDSKRELAEKKRKDIEMQLSGSKLGVAYIDSTERIIQLNRPIENNLLKQIEYLTNLAFSQLNITQGILDGTADDQTMTNYNSRTIEPILSAIADEIKRKFLSKEARDNKESIMFFRDPFKLVPVSQLAELADKLTRNEVTTSNEIRQGMGMKPSSDPKADELRNSNLNHPEDKTDPPVTEETEETT